MIGCHYDDHDPAAYAEQDKKALTTEPNTLLYMTLTRAEAKQQTGKRAMTICYGDIKTVLPDKGSADKNNEK